MNNLNLYEWLKFHMCYVYIIHIKRTISQLDFFIFSEISQLIKYFSLFIKELIFTFDSLIWNIVEKTTSNNVGNEILVQKLPPKSIKCQFSFICYLMKLTGTVYGWILFDFGQTSPLGGLALFRVIISVCPRFRDYLQLSWSSYTRTACFY